MRREGQNQYKMNPGEASWVLRLSRVPRFSAQVLRATAPIAPSSGTRP